MVAGKVLLAGGLRAQVALAVAVVEVVAGQVLLDKAIMVLLQTAIAEVVEGAQVPPVLCLRGLTDHPVVTVAMVCNRLSRALRLTMRGVEVAVQTATELLHVHPVV